MLRLAWLALFSFPLFCQTITATLTGTVRDPQGAAVPAASIVVTSAETDQKRTVTGDSEGRFSVAFLPPGTYSMSVTAKGFGRLTRDNIRLEVAQVAEMDLTLPLETSQQTVEIHEDAAMLVTEASHLETAVENKLITELPSGERS